MTYTFEISKKLIITAIHDLLKENRTKFTPQQRAQLTDTANMLNRLVVKDARCPNCGARRIGISGECPHGCV